MSPASIHFAVLILLAIVVGAGLALWAHANASAWHDHQRESGNE